MAHEPNLTIHLATSADHPAILALYDRCGYASGLAPTDELVIARNAGELVGVVRLCTEQETIVLRGMQVHPDHRRRGIGSQLLDACIVRLGDRACHCLPYDHLIGFYGGAGFQLVEAERLPPFLQDRLHRYRQSGQAVVPMLRSSPVDEPAGAGIARTRPPATPIERGDIFWIAPPAGGPAHPHVVVQDDVLNRSRLPTVVVVALTSNLHRVKEPGNVLLEPGEGDLPRQSVVVVSQIDAVEKVRLGERIGRLSSDRVDQILDGLRFQQRAFFTR